MSLINELKVKSNKAEDVKQEIIQEIKKYFDEYLDIGLEDVLRQNITDSEIRSRQKFLKVEFWEYRSGCSTTSFYCAGKYWYNPENRDGYASHRYKGIELRDISEEIGNYLTVRLQQRMCELGFDVISREEKHTSMRLYNMHFYFGW